MTKFLSKVFLMGILLGSVNGYCSNGVENIFAGCIELSGGMNVLDSDYTFDYNINIGVEIDPRITDNGDSTFTYNGSLVNINPAIFDLNGKTLTTAEDSDNTLTFGKYGQLKGGTIKLSGSNTVNVEPGAKAGVRDSQVTIIDGNVDLSDYINSDYQFDTTNGANLYFKLSGNTSIKLFDHDYFNNTETKKALIEAINENKTSLFPNITKDANSNITIEGGLPYVLEIKPASGNSIYYDNNNQSNISTESFSSNHTLSIHGIEKPSLLVTSGIKYDAELLNSVVTQINNNNNINTSSKINLDFVSFKKLGYRKKPTINAETDKFTLITDEYEIPYSEGSTEVTVDATNIPDNLSTIVMPQNIGETPVTLQDIKNKTTQLASNEKTDITFKGANNVNIESDPNSETTVVKSIGVEPSENNSTPTVNITQGNYQVGDIKLKDNATVTAGAGANIGLGA